MNLILDLFVTFLKIGLFSIGGGYATLPLIQQQAVVVHPWLTLQEFTDIITLSQMTPGPLAVNTSTFVGMRLGGLAGAIAATGGCVLCGILISLALQRFFSRNGDQKAVLHLLETLKSASVGLIAASAATIVLIALCGVSSGSSRCIQRDGTDSICAVAGGDRQRKTGSDSRFDPQRAGRLSVLSLTFLIEKILSSKNERNQVE